MDLKKPPAVRLPTFGDFVRFIIAQYPCDRSVLCGSVRLPAQAWLLIAGLTAGMDTVLSANGITIDTRKSLGTYRRAAGCLNRRVLVAEGLQLAWLPDC